MKTHELAKQLNLLSRILKTGSNIEVTKLDLKKSEAESDSALIALDTLVELSKFSKAQWLNLIKEYSFPIVLDSRDSGRNILGKVLTHLRENKESRNKIKNKITNQNTSKELMHAFSILLKDDDHKK